MALRANQQLQVGRRDDPRVRVGLTARLVTVTGTQVVRLNNISRGGASVTANTPLKRGSNAFLQWGNIDAFTTVTWVEGNRCGLKFDEPIAQSEVLLARTAWDNQVALIKAQQMAAGRQFADGSLRVGYGD